LLIWRINRSILIIGFATAAVAANTAADRSSAVVATAGIKRINPELLIWNYHIVDQSKRNTDGWIRCCCNQRLLIVTAADAVSLLPFRCRCCCCRFLALALLPFRCRCYPDHRHCRSSVSLLLIQLMRMTN